MVTDRVLVANGIVDKIRIPLMNAGLDVHVFDGGEPEPSVDLNTILHELYDLLNYDLVIDYRKDTQPSLKGEDAAWADGLLREHGLR